MHTVLADEFRETQQGTLHFQYLKADEFGHLYVGQTLDEHLGQLEESLRGRDDDGRNERFLRAFVRPLGLDVAATPLYVETLEELAARRRARAGSRARAPLRPAGARAGGGARRRSAPPRGSARSATAFDELRSVLRKVKRGEGEVVAGPWLGNEVEELLYWIPFLRWAQTATFGLRDRLTVVARASSAAWYEGIGSTHADAADFEGEPTIPPELIEELRDELAAGDPKAPFSRRRLEFPAAQPRRRATYAGPWGVDAVLAMLEGRTAVVDTPPRRARPHARRLVPARAACRLAELAQRLMAVEAPVGSSSARREEYAALVRQRLEHLVPVREPLVLVLADPALRRDAAQPALRRPPGVPRASARAQDRLAARGELAAARPRPARTTWFERLFEKKALDALPSRATRSAARSSRRDLRAYDVFPFLFLPRLQKAIFDACVARGAIERSATCSTAYFTSYFNAWLDNQNLYAGPKQVVTGFTPRLAMDAENRDAFFAAYPDGTLVSIVRDPQSWYGVGVEVQPAALPATSRPRSGSGARRRRPRSTERVVARSRTSSWSARRRR